MCTLCSEEEEAATAFELSTTIKDGASPQYFKEVVDRMSVHELVISRSLCGLSHEEFRAAFNGHNPEDLGYRSLELTNQAGKTYRGVLIQDPASPGTKYTYNKRVMISRREPKMPESKHLFPAQGSKVCDYECEKEMGSGGNTSICTKFRTCTLTHAAVMAQAVARSGGPSNPSSGSRPTPGPNPELAKEEGDGEEASDMEGEECEVEGAIGPVVNPAAAALPCTPAWQAWLLHRAPARWREHSPAR